MTKKKNLGHNFGFQEPPLPNTLISEPLLPDPKVLELIKQAITQKRLIEFYYQDFQRIAEPRILGLKDGFTKVLVYQVSGQSGSGPLPDWRRMNVENILRLRLLDETFSNPRPSPSGNHSSWDEIIATVIF